MGFETSFISVFSSKYTVFNSLHWWAMISTEKKFNLLFVDKRKHLKGNEIYVHSKKKYIIIFLKKRTKYFYSVHKRAKYLLMFDWLHSDHMLFSIKQNTERVNSSFYHKSVSSVMQRPAFIQVKKLINQKYRLNVMRSIVSCGITYVLSTYNKQ